MFVEKKLLTIWLSVQVTTVVLLLIQILVLEYYGCVLNFVDAGEFTSTTTTINAKPVPCATIFSVSTSSTAFLFKNNNSKEKTNDKVQQHKLSTKTSTALHVSTTIPPSSASIFDDETITTTTATDIELQLLQQQQQQNRVEIVIDNKDIVKKGRNKILSFLSNAISFVQNNILSDVDNTKNNLVSSTTTQQQQIQHVTDLAETDQSSSVLDVVSTVESQQLQDSENDKKKLFSMDVQHGIESTTISGSILFGLIASIVGCNTAIFDQSHDVIQTATIVVPVVASLSISQSIVGDIVRSMGNYTWNTIVTLSNMSGANSSNDALNNNTCLVPSILQESKVSNNNRSSRQQAIAISSLVATTANTTQVPYSIDDDAAVSTPKEIAILNTTNTADITHQEKITKQSRDFLAVFPFIGRTTTPDTTKIKPSTMEATPTRGATTKFDETNNNSNSNNDDIEIIKKRIIQREEIRLASKIQQQKLLQEQNLRIREKILSYEKNKDQHSSNFIFNIVKQLENEIERGFQQSSSLSLKSQSVQTKKYRTPSSQKIRKQYDMKQLQEKHVLKP
jgi:hypothetical protein